MSDKSDKIYRITPGEVRVNEVTHVVSAPNVEILEIDLHTKYAAVFYTSTDRDTGVVVALHAVDDTLHVDEKRRNTPTHITVRVPYGRADDWTCVAECSRYTARVIIYCSTENEEN